MEERDESRSGRRRALLALLGGAAAAAGVPVCAIAAPACVLAPRQSEGPYFLDARLRRSDIREDSASGARSAGVPLRLQLRVLQADAGCEPLAGFAVEVWHCDARGVYSGVQGRYPDAGRGDFLRGFQLTDAQGAVRFTTIYPGSYPGRTVHVHVKLRRDTGSAHGSGSEWTSQLYFDDRVTDRVHANPPYARSAGQRARNQDDLLFRHGGRDLMLALGEADEGYFASFDLGVRNG
jgi:protocatechuate 3,4-dioxygenase beta subunit